VNLTGHQILHRPKRSRFAAAALIVLVAAAMQIAGCGGSPTVKPAELVKFKPNAQAQVVWHASVGEADVYICTPAVYEGAVYAAAASGTLARFDAASGKQIWRIDTKEPLSGGVGDDGQLVVVASKKGAVLAYDLKGKLAWRSGQQ
jgi:outer membrane protein assembly factor BamB